MSSNTIVGLTSPINPNEAVNCFYCDNYFYDKKVEYKEIFDQLGNIAERIEKIGNKFLRLEYRDNDNLFSEIGFDIRGLAFDLSCIKNDLKK